MSNPNDEKTSLAAQADSVFRDYPAVAAVLSDVADALHRLETRVLVLEKKLEAHVEASQVPPTT